MHGYSKIPVDISCMSTQACSVLKYLGEIFRYSVGIDRKRTQKTYLETDLNETCFK